jgi:hypothetical protein
MFAHIERKERKMNTTTVLQYGHQTVVQTLEGLPKGAWNTPGVCGVWSVKDIIAHLASFEQLLVDVLNSLLIDGPTPTLDKFQQDYVQFNDTEVAARRHKITDEVWAEYKTTHIQTLALLEQIPVERHRQNGILPWYGPEYDLEDFIAYTYYGHKREHSAQIAVFLDYLKEVNKG